FPADLASGFKISVKEAGDAWVVECSGVLDTPDACAAVQPQLLALHRAVVTAKIPTVKLEVQGVEYMNSSGLKSFIVWFLGAHLARGPRVRDGVALRPPRALAADLVPPDGAAGAHRAPAQPPRRPAVPPPKKPQQLPRRLARQRPTPRPPR